MSASSFLLKLTRQQLPDLSYSFKKAEVVGKTAEAYKFNSIADYQFLSHSLDSTTDENDMSAQNNPVIEMIPRPFSKTIVVPLQPIFDKKKLKGKKIDDMLQLITRHQGDPVPMEPPPAAEKRSKFVKRKDQINDTLLYLFSTIPGILS